MFISKSIFHLTLGMPPEYVSLSNSGAISFSPDINTEC